MEEIVLNLQLFAEGGGEGGSAVGAAEGSTTEATVVYGVQPKETIAAEKAQAKQPNPDADFEALIKGDFKKQYSDRVEATVKNRLKGAQAKLDSYAKLDPMVEMMAKRYGVEAGADGSYDYDAIMKAVEEDDSWLEEEAARNGISVAQQRKINQMERDNAQLREQIRQQKATENADKLYSQWMGEADAIKGKFKDFNLESELKNPDFVRMLQSGVTMEAAFKVLHMDDLMQGGMQFAVEQAKKQTMASVAANASRPRENGTSGSSTTIYKSDVNALTNDDVGKIIAQVMAGKNISFS